MATRDSRPSPDELLARLKAKEEPEKKRGKLKIFLGYAAGVGKTYAMLEAAQQRKKELDVVVAYVETHGRPETEAMLEGLEVIPRKQVPYRGVALPEMDLDAVLARRPQLVVVDELAHTNAPESRHLKRYQDVEELLDAGIDVYTTLNVQHIESLRDVVAQVTDVWMRETVPDIVVDNAAEIEIVDLPPEELLKRLKEGKVYIPQQIASATERFFRKGNLTALRELTMNTAAKHVDEQMRDYMKTHTIPGPWPTAERILVCVSPGPLATVLVRTARRLASQLHAEWFVAYAETPGNLRQPPDQRDLISDTLRFAERMGARVVTIQGHSVAEAITDFAGKNNITKIVAGKPRKGWRRIPGFSVVDQIIRRSDNFDVYVVSGTAAPAKKTRQHNRIAFHLGSGHIKSLVLVVLVTLLSQLVRGRLSAVTITMIYLLLVASTAILWGLGPSILVSILSVLAFDFFFVPPIMGFKVPGTQYLFTIVAFLVVSILISYPTSRVRQQTEAARRRERETAALYTLSRVLAVSNDLDSYVRAIKSTTKETFGLESVVFLPDAHDTSLLKPYGEAPDFKVESSEAAAALWSFNNQKIAGHGTDTLPHATAQYLPLITARGTIGVLALQAADTTTDLTVEQKRLLAAYVDLAAVAIEGNLLSQEAQDARLLRATEKLQTALLNSVSQDLLKPLMAIRGTLRSLRKENLDVDESAKMKLVQGALDEVETLNHLISNLLDMSRIEAGAIRPSRQLFDVRDLLKATLDRLGVNETTRPLKIDIPAMLPLAFADFSLMQQALVNVLDNALKYSPPDSPIEISARQVGQQIEIEIADRGWGIPTQDLQHVFDKFYRVHQPGNVAGTGLGLTISKGIVEAHGGRIIAENRAGGGTIVRLTLPTAGDSLKNLEHGPQGQQSEGS